MKNIHIAAAIGFGPLGLLLLVNFSAHTRTEGERWFYEEQAAEAFQETYALDQEYLALQRAYTLLQEGEETIIAPSILEQHLEQSFGSPLLEHASLTASLANLRETVQYLRDRFARLGSKAIHIDLSEQKLALVEQGIILARYPVSSGAWETPTPAGQFQIHRKQTLRISNLETPYRMPNYMAFTENGSHGLHALPYLGESPAASDYWHEARSHIGIPVSHGCVRLLPEDAEKMYEWVEVGTRVYISV